jgi:ABC-type multidrug transport system fused ATPase/permease subunit
LSRKAAKADRAVRAVERARPDEAPEGTRRGKGRDARAARDAAAAEIVKEAKETRAARKAAKQAAKAAGQGGGRAERKARKKAGKRKEGRFDDSRRILRLLRRYSVGQRRAFLLAFVMLLFEAITAVFEPWPLAYLIDFLQGDRGPLIAEMGRNATIGLLTVGLIALAAINSYGDSMSEVYLAKGGMRLGYTLRVALFSHLEKLSLAFHNQRRTGDVLTRVTSDVTAIEEFITDSVSDLAGSIFVLVGTLAFLGWKSPEVMVLAVVIVPLLAFVSNGFASRIKSAAKQQRAREGELASHAQEMLTSIGVIQTYGRGAYERKRFEGHSNRAMQAALRAARLEAGFGWVITVMQALCIAGVVWLGIWLVDRNASTIGDVILYIILIQNMFKPTKRIIKEWNTIGKIYASVERIDELLDREPTVRDEPDAVEAPPLRGLVEFRDVSFAYQLEPAGDGDGQRPRLALDQLSFVAEPGQTIALVGHSGAGKSTIAQLLPRLYDPHDGQVLIDGHDVREFTLTSLRGQISMVLQETVLFTGTVADNIAYGRPDASREEIEEAAHKANAHEFIMRLPDGYETELAERGGNLSGGQRQRLAIARSFIRETPILILDEPTTGLDAESTQLVLDALDILMLGKTTIVISHDLNLIRSADCILVMSAGDIVQRGTHAELIEQEGLYATLHARQFGEAAPPVPASPEPAPLPVAELDDDDDDDEPAPVRRRVFETALMQALPLPASPEAFRLIAGKAPARADDEPPGRATAPASAAPRAAPADGRSGRAGDRPRPAERPAAVPPTGPVLPPAAEAERPAAVPPTGPVLPPAAEAERPAAVPPTGPVLPPAAPPARPRGPAGPPPGEAVDAPATSAAEEPPAVAVGEPSAGPAEEPATVAAATPPTAAAPGPAPGDGGRGPERRGAPVRLPTLAVALDATALDPVRMPAVQAELPGLDGALDGDAMARHLEGLLADGHEIERCTVDKVQYLPGDACIVRYRVGIRHAAAGRRFDRLVTARVMPGEAAAASWLRDRLEPLAAEAAGRQELEPFARPVALVEPLHLAVHAFPLDADLPGLLAATDPPRMAALLGELLPDATDGRLSVEACRVELASYNRKGRCVLRYHLFGSTGDGEVVRRTVYGKVYAEGPGEEVLAAASALQEAIEGGDGAFALPRILGHRAGLVVLAPVPGAPRLAPLLEARLGGPAGASDRPGPDHPDGATLEGYLSTCARVIAAVHRAPVPLGPSRTFEGELTEVRRELIEVGRRCPALGVQLSRWLAPAEITVAATDPFPAGPVHGDLTPAQVLFTGEPSGGSRCGLIDLDTIGQAEPALDLGHFLAHLRLAVRKGERGAGQDPGGLADELAADLLAAYAEAAGLADHDRLRERVAAFESVSLARMALRGWKKRKLARLEDTLRVMAGRTAGQEAGR